MMQAELLEMAASTTLTPARSLKSFTAEGNTPGQAGLMHSFFSQPYHRLRRIDAGDATRGKCLSEADGNVARTTTQVEHMPLGEIRKVFAETIDEALILSCENPPLHRRGLARIVP